MILLQINCEEGEGIELAKNYSIKGYPTFILANKDAETMSRWWGYTKELLFEKLDSGLADRSTIEEKVERFARKPDANTAKVLAAYYETKGEIKEAVAFYDQAAGLEAENDYAYELYSLHRSGLRYKIFTLEEVEKAADNALASEKVSAELKVRVYAGMAAYIRDNQKSEKILSYIADGYNYIDQVSQKDPKWAINEINIAHALYIDNNEEMAVTLKKNSMKEGWQDNAGDLNGFSWWCFENNVNLDEAENLGRRGIKLAQPGREKAMILDTVAEIVNLRGDSKEAISLMEMAIKEDPESDYYPKQIEKFKGTATSKPATSTSE